MIFSPSIVSCLEVAAFSAAAITRRASSRRARRRRRDGPGLRGLRGGHGCDCAYAAVEGEDKECDGGEIPMLAQHDILRRCVHPCYRAISHGTC